MKVWFNQFLEIFDHKELHMKTNSMVLAVAVLMIGCSTPKENQEATASDTQELTPAEETVLVDEISAEIQAETKEVQKTTEESLQEVDSLLKNF